MKDIIVGISGASGAIYGIRLLEVLREQAVRTHLIISKAAEKTIQLETDYSLEEVKRLATVCYDLDDIAAPVSSGSFNKTCGMVILPCSIKTLSALADSFNVNILIRCRPEGLFSLVLNGFELSRMTFTDEK